MQNNFSILQIFVNLPVLQVFFIPSVLQVSCTKMQLFLHDIAGYAHLLYIIMYITSSKHVLTHIIVCICVQTGVVGF